MRAQHPLPGGWLLAVVQDGDPERRGFCSWALIPFVPRLIPAGTRNSFETLQMKLENTTNPWSPSHRLIQPALEQKQYSRERQAAFRLGRPLPRHLLFTNPQKNPWGHRRSYRLQIHSTAEPVLPRGWQEERAITWAR